MDRRKRYRQTVALMSMLSETKTIDNVDIATFDGNGEKLLSLIVGIDPVQAGSGSPSPDNVRPISGWDSVKIMHSGVDISNPNVYTIPLPETVYGGHISVVGGNVEKQLSAIHMSNLTWSMNPTFPHTFNGEGFVSRKQLIDGSLANRCYCSRYEWYTSSQVGSRDFGIALANATSGSIYAKTRIYVSDARFSTVEEFVASFSEDDPIVVCPLDTPVTYGLSDVPTIQTFVGENNIWADTGKIIFLEYEA